MKWTRINTLSCRKRWLQSCRSRSWKGFVFPPCMESIQNKWNRSPTGWILRAYVAFLKPHITSDTSIKGKIKACFRANTSEKRLLLCLRKTTCKTSPFSRMVLILSIHLPRISFSWKDFPCWIRKGFVNIKQIVPFVIDLTNDRDPTHYCTNVCQTFAYSVALKLSLDRVSGRL